MSVVVAGGGITGLAAAWELARAGVEVELVEPAPFLGGKIRTAHRDGFLIEDGPDSFIAYRPAAAQLARELGMGDQIIGTTDPRRVDIRTRGRFVPMPEGMGLVLPTRMAPFVTTALFSPLDKLRMAKDLVLPRSDPDTDVSIGAFLRRRFGQPMIDRLADPLIGGIYGAPVDELSLDAVVPQLREAERGHRSLLLASLAQGRARRAAAARGARSTAGATAGAAGASAGAAAAAPEGAAGPALGARQGASTDRAPAAGRRSAADERPGSAAGDRSSGSRSPVAAAEVRSDGSDNGSGSTPRPSAFLSFRAGMGSLVAALEDRLATDPRIRLRQGVGVRAIERRPRGVLVRLTDGSAISAEAVVIATPAGVAAAAVDALAPAASAALRAIPHGSTGVVSLGYRTDQFAAPPDGHGFLVAGDERLAFGACTWSSRKWAGRAPDGFVLARAFLGERGGALLPLADADVARAVHADLARLAGIRGEPALVRIARWSDAMPRYALGHRDRVRTVETAMAAFPDVVITGGALRGVGVPDCIDQGRAAARRITQAAPEAASA